MEMKKLLDRTFIPTKPFPEFKWKWASLQCTEGLNDPVVLLVVLFRMRKLEGRGLRFSSPEFSNELRSLSVDIKDSIGINLVGRTGDRNLIRNSGQYWKALGLIPTKNHSGIIRLTPFGHMVADHEVSQTEFAALVIQQLTLPNPNIQSEKECSLWHQYGLEFKPLKLLLAILLGLHSRSSSYAYMTAEELTNIIIPLSGCSATVEDYVNFIIWKRQGEISTEHYPNCIPEANDLRIAREFLLFLSLYGYINCEKGKVKRLEQRFRINSMLLDEIKQIIDEDNAPSLQEKLKILRKSSVISEFERKRVVGRPHQARFRREVLEACQRCVVTNVSMPEVLEAAHIKPYKYHGEDTIANGFAMRNDIHILFDTGHLRISPNGIIELSQMARLNYGMTIPPSINIPSFINRDFLRWRWDNYNGY